MASAPPDLSTRIATAPFAAHLILAALAGAMSVLGQSPVSWPLLLVSGFTVSFFLWRIQRSRRAAGWIGWAFGTGYFVVALHWIIEPFQVDVARHGWMAPFALVFLSGGLALFWALAFWMARRLSSRAIVLAFTWTLAEVLRAYIFTGFPWANPAQILVDGPISRLLAWGGPHGATFVLMLLAWVLSLPKQGAEGNSQRVGQLLVFLAAGLAFHLPQAFPPMTPSGSTVRLIQPNAVQQLKWQPQYAEFFYERQLMLTAAATETPPDLIVWPETAIPWRLGSADPVLRQIADAAGGAPVVLGALRDAGDGVSNSLAVIDASGAVQQIYDKHHLVPFGEYIPLAALAGRLGLTGLAANGMGFSPGPGPELLELGPLGRALPLICYEAVFAHDVASAPERPDFLLQITNDAWFGDYAGPQQHLAQARMRAIEQGLPILRAANTGISAAIDPYGRITAALPLGEHGFLDVSLPMANNPTPYARIGDVPIIALLLLGLFAQQIRARGAAHPESD